ncbi:unnamed protein product [Citrullus colocynthis]|uniref:CLAVATA3/ESR (CLE)-related protein n=1 Tax=Citrullus colocynthis TaxID=252529 RepID=A0ABP0XTY4_9ROSI
MDKLALTVLSFITTTMASMKITWMVFKLLFFTVLLIASTASPTEDNIIPSFHKPHFRRMRMEHRTVGKAALRGKPAVYDFPWKGGYNPPDNNH